MKKITKSVEEVFTYYKDFESALENIEDEYIAFRSYSVNKKKGGRACPKCRISRKNICLRILSPIQTNNGWKRTREQL